jgi:predicted NBD/HSP70 family sugar kinase
MSTEAAHRFAIGIDIGGTGIKAALVDTTTGRLPFKRLRVLTPKPGTPTAVAETIAVLLEDLTQQALDLELVTDQGRTRLSARGLRLPRRDPARSRRIHREPRSELDRFEHRRGHRRPHWQDCVLPQ